MRRSLTIAAGLATAALVAGCGSSKPHGFYSMRALDHDISSQITYGELTSAHFQAGQSVKRVFCIRSGRQSATCDVALQNGESGTLHVAISPNGKSYISN